MDITLITAVVGAITGCASLIWNIFTYVGFNLEIYTLSISFEKKEDPWIYKQFLKFTEPEKDISKYSNDVIVIRGLFRILLRREGQRFKNHHVNSLGIQLNKELRETLSPILAEPPLYIVLFPSGETKDLRLFEGVPSEVKVHSNPLFLKKDWESLTNMRLDEVTKKLDDFIKKGQYKLDIQLTTYKYPLIYEKKGDWFHREYLWKRAVNSVRWRLKI